MSGVVRGVAPDSPEFRALAKKIPEPVQRLCAVLRARGHEAYVVGGAVRDLVLGRDPLGDWDVATEALPEKVLTYFEKVIATGLQHGTVTVVDGAYAMEVTTYRTETTYRDGRHPDQVIFVRRLEDDLARRDFTVNAMAVEPEHGTLVDPFGGLADLAAKKLRAVGDPLLRFGEDGLRCLRAVRFAATLSFDLDDATLAAIEPTLPTFRRVAPERVLRELQKLLGACEPSRGLVPMESSKLLAEILPALAAAPAELRARALRRVDLAPRDEAVRFAALFAEVGAKELDSALRKLKASTQLLRLACGLVVDRGLLADATPDAESSRRTLSKITRARIDAALALRDADVAANDAPPAELERTARVRALVLESVRRNEPVTVAELAVDGRDVEAAGAKGALVGKILQLLLDDVLAEPARNEREHLLGRVRDLAAPR